MADAMGTIPDEQELLRRYVEAGDVQAFRQLVDAHRDMVFSVCRRILHNVADAEDAAQDCFLQLARKANTLRAPIAGWVHQVALYVALDLRNRKAQREGRETMSAKMRGEAADPHWEELRGLVDDAVSSLPERLRLPIVLHYLEARTQEEVAAQLRVSQPAVSQRLAKGLELLRKRLKRQGFVASCAALAALFSAHAVEAAPPGLSDSAVKIGFSALTTGAKAAGGKVLTIGGISVFKAAIVAAVAVVLVLGAATVFLTTGAPAPGAPAMKVANDNNAFALDLYAKLKAEPGNLFFSPYSISAALAMTYAGARGDTEKQMAQTLHFGLSQAELHPAFAELSRQEVSSGDYELSVANSLWGQTGYRYLPGFTELTSRYYSAPFQQVDFAKPEEASKTINDWVEAKTNHKITKLVPPEALNYLTRLVLTNAIYFKGTWESPFRKNWTHDGVFTKIDGTEVTVPMMIHETQEFAYAELDNCQVLQMAYVGGRLSMLILLPKKAGALNEVESQLTAPTLAGWIGRMQNKKVAVIMPKFKMTCEFSLGETLAALGMKDAFSLPPADFSGMTGRNELFISEVLHKAFVDVNEEGTEAAAATALEMSMGAEHSTEFVADHPFIFLIRDEKTGSILFIGRVMNPKENEDIGGMPVIEPRGAAPIMDRDVVVEGLAMLGAIRTQENVFKTEKGVFLAVGRGNVSNEPMAARPGLGLDFSRNVYFDANCVSVMLDAKYGFVAICDGTAANNAAPRSADAKTCIIQERGNGESRTSADSGTTFTPWR